MNEPFVGVTNRRADALTSRRKRLSKCWVWLALPFLALAGCGSGQAAATVNGHDISMAAYNEQVHLVRIESSQSTGYDVCAIRGFTSACNQLKLSALDSLIGRELVREYAAQHGITVSEAAARRRWTVVFQQQFRGNQAAVNAWAKHTGQSVQALKQSVRDDQLQQLVMFSVTSRLPTTDKAIRLARVVATTKLLKKYVTGMIRRHASFQEIAAGTRSSPSGGCGTVACGDLGWLPYSLIPADGRILEGKPAGTIVGPVRVHQGWEWYRVEARSDHYHLTPQQQYTLRQQAFNLWLARQIRKADVKRNVPV